VARVQKAAPTGKVNLNTATAEELTALPGVGAKLAARIVEHRQKVGGFKSTQELSEREENLSL
jgi:competence protein ComEA